VAARAARFLRLSGFFRTARADDEMRSFLIDAVEYLSSFAEGNIEVRSASSGHERCRAHRPDRRERPAPDKQDVIRTCLLQIAAWPARRLM